MAHNYKNIPKSEEIKISNIETGAYGETLIAQLTPYIAGNAAYGFIPTNFREFTATGGSTGVTDQKFQVQSGTSAGGYGAIQSFRSINYKVGQGAVIRFSCRFPENSANNWSGCGALNVGNEMSFGYNGTDFGIWHRYGGLPEVQDLQVTGAAGGAENATVTVDGTGYTVPLTSGTVQHNAKEIADYLMTNGVGFEAYQLDDTVQIYFLSDGDKTGTFSFSSATATATFSEITTGVTKTSTHTPISSWNGELFAGFDPSNGNTYEIKYQNGFGDIEFLIEEPLTGKYLKVHTIPWTNNQTIVNSGNPSLRCGLYTANTTGTTNVSVECAYMVGFVNGVPHSTRNPRAFDNTKNIDTTLTNILTIRNKRVYNGFPNQVEIEPRFLTIANDGGKSAVFEVRGNPTVGGTTNFQDVGNNLVSEYDLDGTTVSGGRLLASFVVAKGQSVQIDLKALEIRQPPTLRLVIAGRMASGAAQDLTASLVWYEDIN